MDDALSARQLPDGKFEVGVHIADVSYFVKKVSKHRTQVCAHQFSLMQ